MKSRNLIIAMLAVISMASCRKEESMNPNTANVEPSTALRVSKLIPLTIVSDGKNITTYMYNSQMLPEIGRAHV